MLGRSGSAGSSGKDGLAVQSRRDATRRHHRLSASAPRFLMLFYLRELAAAEARRVRCQRVRAQSSTVAAYVASSPEARAFHEDWGTPSAEDEAR